MEIFDIFYWLKLAIKVAIDFVFKLNDLELGVDIFIVCTIISFTLIASISRAVGILNTLSTARKCRNVINTYDNCDSKPCGVVPRGFMCLSYNFLINIIKVYLYRVCREQEKVQKLLKLLKLL